MFRPCRAASQVALFVGLAALALGAVAGSFQVNPVRVELRNGATSGAVVIRNDGTEPVVVQTSILAWAQADGKDVYSPTREALATPPVATIPPGGEQIVRVGLRRPPDRTREVAFRLYLQEIPGPPQPGFQGLQVALRIGLPVFVDPLTAVTRDFEWSAVRAADGQIKVMLRNRGNVHLQVYDLALRTDAAEPIAGESQLTYVLAGETREWLLPLRRTLPVSVPMLRLNAFTDAGEIDASVRLDP